MKIAIVGYGEQGRSAYEYWHSAENQITICEQNTDIQLPPNVEKRLGPDHLKQLNQFDLIVRSPIVHPDDIVAANSPEILEKVTSVTNEFMRVVPTKNIICVTGTKGKGTTSTLIAKMLETAGKKVHLGGNIGTPPLDMLKAGIQPDDFVILELANFQIIDLKYSPHIAICLMLASEHLDWHDNANDYFNSKTNLFKHQKPDDIAIYFADNEYSTKVAQYSSGEKIPYYHGPGAYIEKDEIIIGKKVIIKTDELKLLGEHNWQNVCAAITAVWQVTQDVEPIREVLKTFSGLEHRLEFVREISGVKYYNDSFATTPDSAIVALKAFKEPKVVILGGSDKNQSFDSLVNEVAKNNVRHIIAIGKTGKQIAELLRQKGFTNITEGPANMAEIITAVQLVAQPGDVVLLSPADASFDMFKNYKERGEQFKKAVQALA